MRVNIGQLLSRRARRDPELEGVYEAANGRRLTYRALNERANQVANQLGFGGVAPGDRVALLLGNGTEFLECFFGAAKIGAVTVPLNTRLVAEEYAFILGDAGAATLVFDEAFADVAAELRSREEPVAVTTWLQVGGTPAEGAIAYDEWRSAGDTAEPATGAGGEDLLFIMYTSGTTGLPKGVMHSHDTIVAMLMTVTASVDAHHGDRYLNALPLFHVGALSPVLFQVFVGGTVVLQRAFDPLEAWQLIGNEQVTSTLLVPAMLQFMLATYDETTHDPASLRWVLSGAAPVPVSLIETYTGMGIEIHQVYGLTETAGCACVISAEDAPDHVGSTGKAFFLTDVRVVDENGTDCPPGVPGEVLVSAPHVMVGYWNRPDATAEAIVDGWLHTGDVATVDENGFVTIVDRIKDMVISGGENVYPAEIENVLLGHEKILDVAVVGIPSAKWGESPLAVVVRGDETLTADEVIAHCRGRLAPFKTVKAVEFVDVIPRNPSGKVLKRELRTRFTYDAPE